MITIIWESPKFTTVDYTTSDIKEQILAHISSYKAKNASIMKFQGISGTMSFVLI